MTIGIVFIAIGVTFLISGSISRVIAYGDFVVAAAFFVLAIRESKNSDDDDHKIDK